MENKEAKRLLSVLEALDVGIYIISMDYTVEYMNKAMVEDFGSGSLPEKVLLALKRVKSLNSSAMTCRDRETLHEIWKIFYSPFHAV